MIITVILLIFTVFLILLLTTAVVHIAVMIPYVPSKMRVVELMIRLARLSKNDIVYDLGCGDARLLLSAEKNGKVKSAIGFEIAPLVYLLARLRAFLNHSKARIVFQSFFSAHLGKANVIFCYLLPNVMPRLADKLKKECKKGTRIISNTFKIPGLTLEKHLEKNLQKGLPPIYVYRI